MKKEILSFNGAYGKQELEFITIYVNKEDMADIASLIKEKSNAFTIVFFINDQYDWTFSNSNVFGIDSWFDVKSESDAQEIKDCIKRIVDAQGFAGIDLNDVKTILNGGRKAVFTTGLGKGENAVSFALSDAIDRAEALNDNIFDCHKLLVAISGCGDLSMSELDALNKFYDKFEGEFEYKWGVVPDSSLSKGNVKLTLLAT